MGFECKKMEDVKGKERNNQMRGETVDSGEDIFVFCGLWSMNRIHVSLWRFNEKGMQEMEEFEGKTIKFEVISYEKT